MTLSKRVKTCEKTTEGVMKTVRWGVEIRGAKKKRRGWGRTEGEREKRNGGRNKEGYGRESHYSFNILIQ